MLLRRTVLMPGESLLSFVIRLAGLNYCSVSSMIDLIINHNETQKLHPTHHQIVYPKEYRTLRRLSEASGVDPDELSLASNHRFVRAMEVDRPYTNPVDTSQGLQDRKQGGITTLVEKHLSSPKQGKYCPLCLRSSNYHRIDWVPRAMSICLDHQCLLLDRCPNCGQYVSVEEIVDRHCRKCESDLCTTDEIIVSGDEGGINSQQFLGYLLGLQKDLIVPDGSCLSECRPAVAYQLVESLQNYFLAGNNIWTHFPSPFHDLIFGRGAGSEYAHAFQNFHSYRAVCAALLDWPTGIFTFLDACKDSGLLLWGYKDFGKWALRYLSTNEYHFVVKELVNYCLDRDSLIPESLAEPIKNENWFIEQTGAMELNLAVKSLGLSENELKRLGIDLPREFGAWVTPWYYDREKVFALRDRLSKSWTLTECSHWLGLDEDVVIELLQDGEFSGGIRKTGINRTVYTVDAESARAYFERINSHLVDDAGGQDFISLKTSAEWLRPFGIKIVDLLKCIEKGLIPCFASKSMLLQKGCFPFSLITLLEDILLTELGFVEGNRFACDKGISPGLIANWKDSGKINYVDYSEFIDCVKINELEELWSVEMATLIRLEPIETESLESYIYRLGKANYYEETNWLDHLLNLPRETHLNFIIASEYLERIAHFLQTSIENIKAMTIHHYARGMVGMDSWGESERNLFISRSDPERRCPICFAESGTVLLPWTLRPITACPIHQILLINACTNCGKILTGETSCRACGQPLEKMDFEKIDQDPVGLQLVGLVWNTIIRNDAKSAVDVSFPFSELISPQFFSLLIKLGTLLLEYDPDNPRFVVSGIRKNQRNNSRARLRSLDVLGYHQVLSAVIELLLDWPTNLYFALKRILVGEEARRKEDESLWKRRSFPYALKKILKSEPGLIWLWNSFQDFVRLNKGNLQGIQYWQKYLTDQPGIVDESDLVSRTLIPHNIRSPKSDAGEILNYKQTMDYLGISRGSLRTLIQKGLLVPLEKSMPNARNKWLFSNKHLEAVTEHLIGHLPYRDFYYEKDEFMLLDTAINYVNHSGLRWIDILESIYNRNLLAYRLPRVDGLRAVWITHAELNRFLHMHHKGSSYSIYTVMKIIGCGVETLVHLANSGLLVPGSGYPGKNIKTWRYSSESIEEYQETYVTTEDAAKLVGCAPRTLLNWVEREWIHAASGPRIDGAYKYRFDRENIVQWRHERLLSKELRELLGISERTMELWVARNKIKPMGNMPQHPYWFDRSEVEKIKIEREHSKSRKNSSKPQFADHA